MSSPDPSAYLEALPNEILTRILTRFPTKDLVSFASVSRHFYLVISHVVHRRLLTVSPLPANELILECYHPSAKISTPYLACRYLGTTVRGDGPDVDWQTPALSSLPRLYSSFRPVLAEENRRPRRDGGSGDETATEDVYLDEGELFSQLCTVTNLFKSGPKPGLFVSLVNVCDGVIRVWRDWLAGIRSGGSDSGGGDGSQQVDSGILWVDPSCNVGVRFRVAPGPAERMPVISRPDDYPSIAYRLQYEELLIRTNKLLLAVEKSAIQEISHSGKDVVIASM